MRKPELGEVRELAPKTYISRCKICLFPVFWASGLDSGPVSPTVVPPLLLLYYMCTEALAKG